MQEKGKNRFGRLLHVDLTSGTCSFSKFPGEGKSYFGGRGFNIWYLYQHLPQGTDPLSSDNILIFSCGLLTGSAAPGSARLHINSLSPLTGILGSSNIGGYAGAWLRSCNIASVIITGFAENPVYLSISHTKAKIVDAVSLWGKDTFETQKCLSVMHEGRKIKNLVIGPAGENQVRFASIISGKDHAAGRTGMGAVMGAKNLKAIVVEKGDYRHFPADTKIQRAAIQTYISQIKKSPEFSTFSKYGGAGYLSWVNDMGIMGSKNYSAVGTGRVEQIDGRRLENEIIRSSGCYRCPVQCKAELKSKNDEKNGARTRPEFEPIVNLGPKCGLNDFEKIISLDNLCNRLGVDSTSAATVISFVMDLYDRQKLPDSFAEGLDLTWGNADTMEKLLLQMVQKKGLGKILCLGVKEASKVFGSGTAAYAAHVKGLELTAYHPGTIMGTALGYAVSSRGGDFNNVYASLEYSMTPKEAVEAFGTEEAIDIKKKSAKGYLIQKAVIINSLVDSLGLCKVPVLSLLRSFNLEYEIELINQLCGLEIVQEQLFERGKTIAAVERKFNIKHANEPIQDTLPEMFFNGKTGESVSLDDFKAMLKQYYTAMGWDKNGIPPE